jgi:hypothetical protein
VRTIAQKGVEKWGKEVQNERKKAGERRKENILLNSCKGDERMKGKDKGEWMVGKEKERRIERRGLNVQLAKTPSPLYPLLNSCATKGVKERMKGKEKE